MKNIIRILLLIFVGTIAAGMNVQAAVLGEPVVTSDNRYVTETYDISSHMDTLGMGANEMRQIYEEYDIDIKYANQVRTVVSRLGKNCCYANESPIEEEVMLYVSGDQNLSDVFLCSINPDAWSNSVAHATVVGKLSTGEACSVCGGFSYREINYKSLVVRKYKPVALKGGPENVTVNSGESATYSVNAKYTDAFRWQVGRDGNYYDLTDGVADDGTVYTGCNTASLTVSNINANRDGDQYRCVLIGVRESETYSNAALLSIVPQMEEEVIPTPTAVPTSEPMPTNTPIPVVTLTPTATPIPTATPEPTMTPTPVITKTPTLTPAPTAYPTKVPITTLTPETEGDDVNPTKIPPKPSAEPKNKPSSSSSSYKTSSSSNYTDRSSSSSSTSSSEKTSSTGRTIIYEDIPEETTDVIDNEIKKKNGISPAGARRAGDDSNGKSTNDGKGNKISVNNYSNTVVSNTAKTTMRDGILYILDDEDEDENIEKEDEQKIVEEYVLENEYSAGDLVDGESHETVITKKKYGISFYAGIIIGAILLLAILLFLLFFGVIVEGECEESDDVFDICRMTIISRKEGNWHINLKESFEDNAVLRLRMGLLFVVIFKDTELQCEVTGNYAGDINCNIEQKSLLYRKAVRRIIS